MLFKKKVVCGIVLNNKGDLLITRRAKGDYKGQWEFPGGKVEANESNIDCLHRELFEELKITVKVHFKFMEFDYQYPEFKINLISYICTMNKQNIVMVDHDKYEWIKISSIFEYNFLVADDAILRNLKKNFQQIIIKLA